MHSSRTRADFCYCFMSYIVSKLMLKICSRVCLQSVIWYFRGSVPCPRVPHRSPGLTLSCVRRFAFRFRPSDARLPIAAGQAWCWARNSPTRRCEDALVISLFRPRELRESRAKVLHLIPDGSGSQLQRQERRNFWITRRAQIEKVSSLCKFLRVKQFASKSLHEKSDSNQEERNWRAR